MSEDPYKYYRQHSANLEKYAKQLKAAYEKTIRDILKSVTDSPVYGLAQKTSTLTLFEQFPGLSKRLDSAINDLYTQVHGLTVEGVTSEWDLAVEQNNKIAEQLFGKSLADLPEEYRSTILSNNNDARLAFLRRTENGLNLSDRVWNNSKQFKQEMELALEVGIGKGKSASTMAKDIKQYLNNPDKLFRRVRDEKGVLRLSKAAAVYHPGQGVYRSSYKNAFRVTRNETNFAYESSNQEKRKQQDFIVGIRIQVSPSHNAADDKGGISCDALQGDYPKTFDFSRKWHINCKCMSLNILKTPEEIDADIDEILAGGGPSTGSKNQIKKIPTSFTKYVKDNEKMWENWKSKPNFLINHRN